MVGRMKLWYTDDAGNEWSIDLGTVLSISNTFQKKVTVTPIVSQNMQSAFPIETGNSQTYSVSFKRTQPSGWVSANDSRLVDSRMWSNAYWYQRLTDAVDRWQTRTNGASLIYESEGTNAYLPDLHLNGYVKSINRTYSNDFNEVISGTLEYTVGTMYVNEPAPTGNTVEDYNDLYIMISDSSLEKWYILLYPREQSGKYNCVDSFTITGGIEDPFEHATIKMPRKKLMEQIPALAADRGIIDGVNKIFINGFGKHSMFVQHVDVADTVTIDAYCDAQRLRGFSLTSSMVGSPSDIIRNILTGPDNGSLFSEDCLMMKYKTENDSENLTFPAGTMLYRALQMCAMTLGCRLFFADDKAYVVDYTVPRSMTSGYTIVNVPLTYAGRTAIDLRDRVNFGNRTVGTSSCDPIGADSVQNQANIVYTDNGVIKQATVSVDKQLIDAMGRPFNKGSLNVPELNLEQATTLARNHLKYLCEPQRAMVFTLKEVYSRAGSRDKAWASYFGSSALLDSITDDYTSERVTNTSIVDDGDNLRKAPQKLSLSKYTRHYPRGTCEYTFGMAASVDLSDNIAQTNNNFNAPRV